MAYKMKILILGATGMLGSMILDFLSTKDLEITATLRKEEDKYQRKYRNVRFLVTKSLDGIRFDDYDFIINCIGIIKQKLDEPKEAILVNSLFPYIISEKAPKASIIQIATDCVYSGKRGQYTENDEHDPLDIYGKTKSLGEVDSCFNIRTSIIGPDRSSRVSLLEWFLSQKKNATVKGYTNHRWNGITTLHFAKLCYAIIKKKRSIPNHLHFVPTGVVSKYELLKIFSEKFNRKDIYIKKSKTDIGVNRSLRTIYPEIDYRLWKDVGYKSPLMIQEMVEELAKYIKDRNFYEL